MDVRKRTFHSGGKRVVPPADTAGQIALSADPTPQRMRRLLYWVLGALIAMAILSALLSGAMRGTTVGGSFAAFHLLLEFPSIIVAFAIFMVRWQARRWDLGLRNWILSCGFLAVGLLDLFHALGFPGMSDFLTPSSAEKGIHFWLIARTVAAATLLLVSWIPPTRQCREGERRLLIASGVAAPVILLGLITYSPGILPEVFEPGVGLTSAKIAGEIVIMLLMGVAAWRFWNEYRLTKERWAALLVLALVISIFSEIAFTQYRNVTDAFIIQGHLLKIVAYLLIYFAVFTTAVESPYQGLLRTDRNLRETLVKLDAERRAAVAAKDRAELYLDFMSHDIANFITPIGPYAELLKAQQGVSPLTERSATAILTQSRRASRFIQAVRRLTEAELLVPEDFVRLDLGKLLRGAVEVAVQGDRPRRIQVSFDVPETRCEVFGGEQLADVFIHLVENAARFDPQPTARIEIHVRPCTFERGLGWQVSIADHGPGIPPERRELLLRGFSPEEPKYKRGLASTFPILARLVSHFGGRMEIADRIPGDAERGTIVKVFLPSAEAPPPTSVEAVRSRLRRVLTHPAADASGNQVGPSRPGGGEPASASGGGGSSAQPP